MGVSAIPPERPLIIWHPLDTPPPGYVKANGAEVSRTAYAWAFEKFGTKYGAGDGVNTFRLGPDLRGEFQRGVDDGRGVDPGRVLGSSQDASRIGFVTDQRSTQQAEADTKGDPIGAGANVYVMSSYYNNYAPSAAFAVGARPKNTAGLFCVAIAP